MATGHANKLCKKLVVVDQLQETLIVSFQNVSNVFRAFCINFACSTTIVNGLKINISSSDSLKIPDAHLSCSKFET